MHFSLSVIASLLPLSLAAPYAYAPPPPTKEQWQAAAANLKVNSLFSSSASTGSGSNSGSSGKGETLLRDAAIFSAGRQGASSVPGRSEHIKVRRRLDKGHSGMHSRKVKVSNKRRACTAKAGTEPAQAPVMLAAGVPSDSASAPASASSVSASAEAPAQSESVEGFSAESETPAVESDSNGIVGGVVDALFPMSVRSKWSTAQSEGSALSCKLILRSIVDLLEVPALGHGLCTLLESVPCGTEKKHIKAPKSTILTHSRRRVQTSRSRQTPPNHPRARRHPGPLLLLPRQHLQIFRLHRRRVLLLLARPLFCRPVIRH